MTFEQLLVFHTIVQTGGFKAAANELHKTQPAISLAIKKLEEEMQVELFDRTAYRPSLTNYGRSLHEKSFQVMQGMKDLEMMSKTFQQKEGPEIAVSMDGICLNPNLLKLFKSFGDRHPYTKLNMSFDILSEAEQKVLSKEAQFGITHFVTNKQLLETKPITFVKMIPVMKRELYKEKKIKSQKDLLAIDQIIVTDKNPQGASFGILDEGKKWRLVDNNFKRDIILAGMGWGHLPASTIEREIKEKKLVVLNFEDIRPRGLEIYLVKLKKHRLGAIAKKFWDELISFHL